MIHVTSANENLEKDHALDSSLVFMLRLSRLCGMTPLTFSMIAPGRFTSSPALAYHVYGWILIPSIIILRGYGIFQYSLCSLETFASDMKSLFRFSEQFLMTLLFLATLMTMKTRMEKFKVFFELSYTIEQDLGSSARVLVGQDRKAMFIGLLTFFISLLLNTWDTYIFASSSENRSVGMQLYVPLAVMKTFMWVMEMEFIFLMKVISIRADALVSKVKCFKDGEYNTNTIYRMLQSVVHTHTLLRISARILNSALELPLLCLIILSLFHLIITPAFVTKYVMDANFPIVKGILQLAWLSLHIMWITLLVETAHQLHQKDTTISIHILDLITTLGDNNREVGAKWRDEHLNRLLLRERMMMSSAISITAFGMCELSRGFLGTMEVAQSKTSRERRSTSTSAQHIIFDGKLVFIIKLFAFCGLIPLIFRRQSGRWTARKSRAMYAYGLFFIFITVISRAYGIIDYLRKYSPSNDSYFVLRITEMPLVCSSLLIALKTAGSRADAILAFTQTLEEIKLKFEPYTKSFANADLIALVVGILALILTTVISLIMSLYIFSIKDYDTLHFVSYYITTFSNLVMQMTFIYLIQLLVIRAGAIISKLQYLKHSRGKWRDAVPETSQVLDVFPAELPYSKKDQTCKILIEELEMISVEQERLRTAAVFINSAFDAPLLLILLLSVMNVTTTTAFLIRYSISEKYTIFGISMNIASLSRHVWWMVAMLETCHQLGRKDALISAYQSDLLKDLSEKGGTDGLGLSEEVKLDRLWRRQEITISLPLQITAFGICQLNRPLMGTISGAITTYIVILMQVQKNSL